MTDLLDSFKRAFSSSGKAAPSIDDPSNVVIDDPENGFVVVPSDVAQKMGVPALLMIKPSQVPKDAEKRAAMTALYRKRKAERIAREQAAEAKRTAADAELAEKNKPFMAQQAERAAASMKAPALPPNVTRAMAGVDAVAAQPAPQPRDPDIDVSPVGQMAAPVLPRAPPPPVAAAPARPPPSIAPMLTRQMDEDVAPPSLASIPAPVLKAFAQQRLPDEAPDISPLMALPMPRAATPAPVATPPIQPEEEPIRAAPSMFAMPAATEAPKPPPSRDFAALSTPDPMSEHEWGGFDAPEPRVTDSDRAALLAMAGGRVGSHLRAPTGIMGGEAMGTRTMDVPPSMVAQGSDMDARDAAALKALAAAQRSDDFSAGLGALGDQFAQARDLILNIKPQGNRARGGPGEAVRKEQERQALLAAQQTGRRQDRLADATVASKKNDAAKDEAALLAAQEKQKKTATDAATAAALSDPSSPESSRIRETVTQLLGQRVDASTLEKLSGAELKDVALKYGVSLTNAEQNAGLRALQIQQTGEDADQAAAIRRMGLDIQMQELELAKKRLAQQQQQFDDSLNDKEQARKDAAATKDEAHSEKMAQLNVGGFKFDAKNPPSIQGAKTMADVAVAKDEVLGSLDRLEDLYSRSGPTMLGDTAGRMETEWMNITNRLRTLNEMGVPNGADYMMLAKQLQDPTSLAAKGTSAARARAQFEQLRDQVRRKVDATAKAYKYEPEASGGRTTPSASMPTGPDGNPTLDGPTAPPKAAPKTPTSSEAKATKPKPGQVKIRDAVNNAYYIAPAARAAELIKKDPKKWQEVERG